MMMFSRRRSASTGDVAFFTLYLLLCAGARSDTVSAISSDSGNGTATRAHVTEERSVISWRQLDGVLNAIDDALKFMKEEAANLNLDAVIGTRIVEGQLDVLLSRMVPTSGDLHWVLTSSSETVMRLRRIRQAAFNVSEAAVPNIRRYQQDYYNKIWPVIGDKFWRLNYRSRDLDTSLVVRPRYRGEAMRELDSDGCLSELFGTSEKSSEKCRVTSRCWKMMTSPGYRYYSLTHQVFYFEIGQQFGCFESDLWPLMDKMNAAFCASIYVEAAEIAKEGFYEFNRDLFMEQAALCGMLGYRQFFCSDWLNPILSWQRQPRGCWGLDEHHMRQITRSDGHRVKREERILSDGCQCHRTAVALGALVQYIRYVIESRDHIPEKCPSVMIS